MGRPKKPEETGPPSQASWGVEIVFNDEHRLSAFHGVLKVAMDHRQIILDLDTGESIAYEFADVKRVLSMRSSVYESESGGLPG